MGSPLRSEGQQSSPVRSTRARSNSQQHQQPHSSSDQLSNQQTPPPQKRRASISVGNSPATPNTTHNGTKSPSRGMRTPPVANRKFATLPAGFGAASAQKAPRSRMADQMSPASVHEHHMEQALHAQNLEMAGRLGQILLTQRQDALARVSELEDEVAHLEASLVQSDDQGAATLAENKRLHITCQELRDTGASLRSEVSRLRREIAQRRQSHADQEKQKQVERSLMFDTLQREAKSLLSEIHTLRQNTASQASTISSLQESLAESSTNLDACAGLEVDCDKLRQKLDSERDNVKRHQKETNELRDQLDDARSQASQIEDALHDMKAQNAEQERLLEELRDQNHHSRKNSLHLDSQTPSDTESDAPPQTPGSDASSEVSSLLDEFSAINHQTVTAPTPTASSPPVSPSITNTQAIKDKARLQQLRENQVQTRKDIKRLKAELRSETSKHKSMVTKQAHQKLETKIQQLEDEKKEHRRKTHQQLKQVRQFQNQLSESQAQVKQLQEEAQLAAQKAAQLQKQQTRQRKASVSGGSVSSLKAGLAAAQKSITELQDKLSMSEQRALELIPFQHQVQALTSSLTQAKKQVDVVSEERDSLSSRCLSLRHSCAEMESRYVSIQADFIRSQRQLHKLQAKSNALKHETVSLKAALKRQTDEQLSRFTNTQHHQQQEDTTTTTTNPTISEEEPRQPEITTVDSNENAETATTNSQQQVSHNNKKRSRRHKKKTTTQADDSDVDALLEEFGFQTKHGQISHKTSPSLLLQSWFGFAAQPVSTTPTAHVALVAFAILSAAVGWRFWHQSH